MIIRLNKKKNLITKRIKAPEKLEIENKTKRPNKQYNKENNKKKKKLAGMARTKCFSKVFIIKSRDAKHKAYSVFQTKSIAQI